MTIKMELWGTDIARLLLLIRQGDNPGLRLDCIHVRALPLEGVELMATNGHAMAIMRSIGHLEGADYAVVRVPRNLRSQFNKDGVRLLVTGRYDAVLKTRKGGIQIGDAPGFDFWAGGAGLAEYVDWRRVATPPADVTDVTGLVNADALGLLEEVLGPSRAMRVLSSPSKPDLCWAVPQRSVEYMPHHVQGFGAFYMPPAKAMRAAVLPDWAREAA